ncbi:phage holin family protein [Paenibacillus thermotolerans]|uniref:phage holin family protein n=1 Tax=Paenibacillus thermotolerans TaxID=3027807 RepID=UPI0023679826|nr:MULTISPECIES: phage holin family protein [unclassified Paenibacillus]
MQRFIKAILSLETLAKPANAGAAFIGAIIGPLLDQALNSGKFWAYVLFGAIIAGDWIAGVAAAKKSKTYSSAYGISGAFRTMLLLWIPFIGWLLDKVSQTVFGIDQPGYAFYALTIMLAYHSWESLTANAIRAGWKKWIPKSVISFVSSELKAKAEREAKKLGG